MVVSPDVGGIKIARLYSNHLHMRLAVVDKRRMGPEEIEVGFVIGPLNMQRFPFLSAPMSSK